MERLSIADQVRAKQARLVELLAEVAEIEQELNRTFVLLSPAAGRRRPMLVPPASAVEVSAPSPAVTEPPPPVEPPQASPTAVGEPATPDRSAESAAAVERQVRHALMTGPFATPNDAYELRTLKERCEDIAGPATVVRVVRGLLARGLVTRDGQLYRRAA